VLNVDRSRCTGCGACVEVCPQGAIKVWGKVAVIDRKLCSQCGSCVEVCPSGAIRAAELVYAKSKRGGGSMYYGYGRGFGFRGASPPWPYIGRGRGGLPRCWYPGTAFPYAPGPMSYAPGVTREQELGFLREEAEAIKRHMEDVEARIKELESRQD